LRPIRSNRNSKIAARADCAADKLIGPYDDTATTPTGIPPVEHDDERGQHELEKS